MFFGLRYAFLLGYRLTVNTSFLNGALFAAAFLLSAYNHIYALIAVAGIALYVNLYILITKRTLLVIVFADLLILVGYCPWLRALFFQTENAASNFWLTSLEPLSLMIFGGTVLLFLLLFIKKKTSKKYIAYAMFSILFVEIIGLAVSVILRPLYIARYAAPLMGIFALLLAGCFYKWADNKKVLIILCCIMLIQYLGIAFFEYSPSWTDFQHEFQEAYNKDDIFIYTDSSFGPFLYYYPESEHICFNYQSWFRAFENLEYEEAQDFFAEKQESRVWYVVNQKAVIPEFIKENGKLERRYSFRNDFNVFDVYLVNGI